MRIFTKIIIIFPSTSIYTLSYIFTEDFYVSNLFPSVKLDLDFGLNR